ncbi:MAG: hypothetical protein HC800_24650 [Phormidesmis sp. RL_2_1]|nr:hypothetical protein [Phormidesmis sp. RL_2_1]
MTARSSVRQFSLGGPSSVRGYRQDAVIADSGLIVTAEVDIPVLKVGRNHQMSLVPLQELASDGIMGRQSARQ